MVSPGNSKQRVQNTIGWNCYLCVSVTYYVATKFEALAGRGGDDLRTSHDFEDIIYILNSCPDFIEHLKNETDEALKQYLKEKWKH